MPRACLPVPACFFGLLAQTCLCFGLLVLAAWRCPFRFLLDPALVSPAPFLSLSFSSSVGFSVPLTARDFLRPTEMTTQVYGPLWGQFGAEVKHELRASMGSSQNFMNVIKTQVGIHPIETRGQVNDPPSHPVPPCPACLPACLPKCLPA